MAINSLIDFEIAYHIHDEKKYIETKHLSPNFNTNNIYFTDKLVNIMSKNI